MDAIDALHSRVSVARLEAPAPNAEQLDIMLRAALRAPDHGLVRPWRFLVLEGDDLNRLGDVLVQARQAEQPDSAPETLERLRCKPLRAPMVLVAVAETNPNHRVPVLEQIISTGAAVQNLLVAAHALGVGAMWRTGGLASHPLVKRGLGFAEKDEIVAFVYLGTPVGRLKTVPAEQPAAFIRKLP